MKITIVYWCISIVLFATSFNAIEQQEQKKSTSKQQVLDYKLHKCEDEIDLLYNKKYLTPDQQKRLKLLQDSVKVLIKELNKLGVKK